MLCREPPLSSPSPVDQTLEDPLDVAKVPRVTQTRLCFQVIHERSHGRVIVVTQGIHMQLGTVTWKVKHRLCKPGEP